ncbi:hypothetical protein HHI36_004570 [Cryptolaemus montrouzieri]|uniref:Uncharacterized protein n=1 Tax=Cryptolaemus montrouzieri TaxID=559131 RepID=A0ABD2NRM4_9CUCU
MSEIWHKNLHETNKSCTKSDNTQTTQFQTKKNLRKTSITLSFTDENIQQTQPPWITKAPKVNLELDALGAKSNTKPSNYQLLHDRIRENHPDHSYYYTDRSKTVEGAGCSIVLDDIEPQVWSFKLPRDAEIFA